MSKIVEEFEKSLEQSKRDLMLSFVEGKITLEKIYEKFQKIKFIEEYLREKDMHLILLDSRQIRELAGKTLYISLPHKIMDFGWDKGDVVSIYIRDKGGTIILKKSD